MTNDPILDEMEREAREAKAAIADYAEQTMSELGEEALNLQATIAAQEQRLKDTKKDFENLMRHVIPARLHALGTDEFGFEHDGGRGRIKLDTKVVGSLRYADNEQEAVDYLEANGFSGAVKTKLALEYMESEADEMQMALEGIEHLTGRMPMQTRDIHFSTLASFVKQRLKEDPTFDYAKVGMTAFPMAKLTVRK